MKKTQRGEEGMLALTPEEEEVLLSRVEKRLLGERPPRTPDGAKKAGLARSLSALRPDEPVEKTGEELLSLSQKVRGGFYTVSRTVGGVEE